MVEQDTTVFENHFALNEVGRCQAATTATLSQENSGTIRPLPRSRELPDTTDAGCRLKIRPTLRAPPTNAKQSNSSKLLPHTDPNTPCQHSASFETPRQESDRYLQIVKKMERWSRVVHLRHPSSTQQEQRHTPEETQGQTAPSKVPRVTRRHG